jgi:hypothetical protein
MLPMKISLFSLVLATVTIIVAAQIEHFSYSQTEIDDTGLLPIPEFKPKPPTVPQQEAEQPQYCNGQ